MKLVVELAGRRAEELYMNTYSARQQLDNALKTHAVHGHCIRQKDIPRDLDSHYVVATPKGNIEYWLEA